MTPAHAETSKKYAEPESLASAAVLGHRLAADSAEDALHTLLASKAWSDWSAPSHSMVSGVIHSCSPSQAWAVSSCLGLVCQACRILPLRTTEPSKLSASPDQWASMAAGETCISPKSWLARWCLVCRRASRCTLELPASELQPQSGHLHSR